MFTSFREIQLAPFDIASMKKSYAKAKPFPHIVIDNIFRDSFVEDLASDIILMSEQKRTKWYGYNNPLEKKLAMPHMEAMSEELRMYFHIVNSGNFLRFLEDVTGIKGLLPDPHLNGGGIHYIPNGGKLDLHVDYNYHPETELDRRLNILLYLNKNWKDEWGGCLELWNTEKTECKVIGPTFNRMVIFSTTEKSIHGHPRPTKCPHNWPRLSLATYYYTNGRPDEEKGDKHSTVFHKHPEEKDDPAMDELRKKRSRGRL